MFPQKLLAAVRDRLAESRFFTISLTLHALLIVVLATVVVVRPLTPPEPEFVSSGPDFVERGESNPAPLLDKAPPVPQPKEFTPQPAGPSPQDFARVLDTAKPDALERFTVPSPAQGPTVSDAFGTREVFEPGKPCVNLPPGLTAGELKEIGKFTDYRIPGRSSKGEYEFTAYIGRYKGNWHSTVRLHNGQITAGSLPNLLSITSRWTKDRLKTNERNVKAIPLDSDEIFTTRPPFIFLTGTQDFRLTDREVENLRKYIRLGGAVWGDSSVPGRRSAFDIAFEREMKRVLGGDQVFEALPDNHPIFTQGYFPKVKALPEGLNYYREPVRVLRWGGEIAVIQTRNDYGDMWQIGLTKDGKFDLSRNIHGQYVAMNSTLWANRGVYVRNIDQPAVEQAYRFGINVIFHLITRWEARTARLTAL